MSDRNAVGHFQPGHALPGPGRPKGPSASERVAAYLEPHMQEILDKAIELAKQGDPASQRLIMERYSPAPKQTSESVSIPGFASAETLQEKAEAVLVAAASGACSAEAAERLLRVLDTYSKAIKADELEARIQALEGRRPRVIEPDDADVADLI